MRRTRSDARITSAERSAGDHVRRKQSERHTVFGAVYDGACAGRAGVLHRPGSARCEIMERERYVRRSGGDPDPAIMLLAVVIVISCVVAMCWSAIRVFGRPW